jgi:hypothetical protein
MVVGGKNRSELMPSLKMDTSEQGSCFDCVGFDIFEDDDINNKMYN